MKKLLAYVLFALSLLCVALRSEAQDISRPTSETSTSVSSRGRCSGSWVSGTMPNFWDGAGESTSTTQAIQGSSTTNDKYKSSILGGFPSFSGTATSLTLVANYACGGLLSACRILYTTNNWSTWTLAEQVNTPTAQHSVSITLNPSQDMSQFGVQWVACGGYDTDPLDTTITGYDVRVEAVITHKRKHHVGTWR